MILPSPTMLQHSGKHGYFVEEMDEFLSGYWTANNERYIAVFCDKKLVRGSRKTGILATRDIVVHAGEKTTCILQEAVALNKAKEKEKTTIGKISEEIKTLEKYNRRI